MNDYLSNLVTRSFSSAAVIQPRPTALFEPPPPGAGGNASMVELETKEEVTPQGLAPGPVRSIEAAGRMPPLEPFPMQQPAQSAGHIPPSEPVPTQALDRSVPDQGQPSAASDVGSIRSFSVSNAIAFNAASSRPSPVSAAIASESASSRPSPASNAISAESASVQPSPASNAIAAASRPSQPTRQSPQPPQVPLSIEPGAAPIQPRIVSIPEPYRQRTLKDLSSQAAALQPLSNAPLPDLMSVRESHGAAPTTIQVTIGRVEVRAIVPPAPIPAPPPPAAKKMSLENYLNARNGGKG